MGLSASAHCELLNLCYYEIFWVKNVNLKVSSQSVQWFSHSVQLKTRLFCMEKPKFEGFGMLQNEFIEFGHNYQKSNDVSTIYMSSSFILKNQLLRQVLIWWQKMTITFVNVLRVEFFFKLDNIWNSLTSKCIFQTYY